jgi:hypothetical protein
MNDDWNSRLRGSPFRNSTGGPSPIRRLDPIDVVIGIDFGTRFTKIAISKGLQRYVWEDEAKRKLFPSVVYVANDGRVFSYPQRPPSGSEKIEYIKMLLADPNGDAFKSVRPRLNGKPIGQVIRPLAAKFLGDVIRHVRHRELTTRTDLTGRSVNWLVNVGVPASHCDSNMEAFKEVAAVAFAWSEQNIGILKLDDLCILYQHTLRQIDKEASPAAIVPELTAGLHEFVKDPNRADSLYGFFDVGGGTLDGAIFWINRSDIGLPLQIHASRVDHCGTMALSRAMLLEIYQKMPHYIERALIGPNQIPHLDFPLNEALSFRDNQTALEEIQNLVGSLVQTTKRHLYGRMFSPRVDATERDTPPLRVFVAGGGANSGWYKSAIEATFQARGLEGLGLTGIRSEIVPKPSYYRQDDYPRFVIALGLADFSSALVDARLPSQFRNAQSPQDRRSPDLVTKDQV